MNVSECLKKGEAYLVERKVPEPKANADSAPSSDATASSKACTVGLPYRV